MSLCAMHHYPLDERLGCCWRCLSAQRDPAIFRPELWWISPRRRCRCPRPVPSPGFDRCLQCGFDLPELKVGRAA